MIDFRSFTLENGLRVFVHEDLTVQTAVMNLLYDVGSKDEDPGKTGFAHLFEHLMFGGSMNIPNYDEPLQRVGGENNAFTSLDITNYYLTVPAQNLETGFWLESDRMLSLSFDPHVLEVQRKVVIEEFKQRYLDQPYGDVWLKFRPLVYQNHPYQWPTIGKEISHIENATMEDVKEFFFNYYRPNNAILVVAGNVYFEEVEQLANKWFGPISAGQRPVRNLPKEPIQNEERRLTVSGDVPSDALYMAYHMPGKFDKDYHASDLISDILGRGNSSRLYDELVKNKKMFHSLASYVTGSVETGLLVISGKLESKYSLEDGEKAIKELLNDFLDKGVKDEELEKVKNQAEASHTFSEVEVLNRAMNLAFGALSGDANWINEETNQIQQVTTEDVMKAARNILRPENSSIMYYRADGK
ncbi:MAG: M16 family metallopeptidase [Candidatus Cyclobacteriaceae bacterium M2_1C_046]